MDSLFVMIQGVMAHKTSATSLIIFLAGFLIPMLVGMMLPRRKTIGYGRFIYGFLGTLMLQKRVHTLPSTLIGNVLTVIRATFVDMSYGVYIESRRDLTKEQKEQKISEFLAITYKKEEPQDATQPPTQSAAK